MKIGIAGPMTLSLLNFDFKNEKMPAGYPFPMIAHIINALKNQGHQIVAYTTSWDTKKIQVFENEGFTICVCPRWRNAGRNFFKHERAFLAEVMKSHPADIINAQWSYEFAQAAIDTKIPTLITLRDHASTILKYERNLFAFSKWWLNRSTLKKGQHFATNSDYLFNLLSAKVQNHSRVIPNFFINDLEKQYQPNQTKENYIISISNLSNRRKNLAKGLEAFQLLRAKFPQLKYYLIGKGSERDGLMHQYAKKHNLSEGIEFLGHCSFLDTINYIKNAKVLLHPSLEESFGNVVLEAMVAGTAVVGGKKSGNIPYLLNQGKAGLLCNVSSAKDIAETLSDALINEDKTINLQQEAHKFALSNYSQNVVIEKLTQYYSDILNK